MLLPRGSNMIVLEIKQNLAPFWVGGGKAGGHARKPPLLCQRRKSSCDKAFKMQMFNMQSDHIAQYLKQSVVWPSTGCCGWEKFDTPPLIAMGARKDSVLCGESHVAFNVRNTITRHKAGLSLKQGWYMDRCHLEVRNCFSFLVVHLSNRHQFWAWEHLSSV